jgi:hypothetical protein
MEPQDYNGHVGTVESDYDEQGRKSVDIMTDHELAVETVRLLRQFADGLAKFNEAAQSNPMMKNLLGL